MIRVGWFVVSAALVGCVSDHEVGIRCHEVACNDDGCAGQVITQGQAHLVATSSSAVYWTDMGTSSIEPAVLSQPLAGGAITAVGRSSSFVTDLEARGNYVLWSDNRSVNAIDLATGSEGQISNHPVSYGFGLDATHAYVGTANGQALARVELATALSTNMPVANYVLDVVVNANNVYYTACNGVYAIPSAGGEPTQVAPGFCPIWIAANSTSVLWTDSSPQAEQLRRFDLGSQTIHEVASFATDAHGLAADERHAYVQQGAGTVCRVSLDDGTVERVADHVHAFAIAGSAIYFSTPDGELRKHGL